MPKTELRLPTWPEVIKDACRLWLRLDRFGDDATLVNRGVKIIYAIDTDLLTFYGAPRQRTRYSQILNLLTHSASETFSLCLSHEVFFGRENEVSDRELVLIPPHDEEVLGVYTALQHAATKDVERAQSRIKELVETIRATHDMPPNDAIDIVLGRYSDIVSVLFDDETEGALSELKRWHRLFKMGRVRLFDPPAELTHRSEIDDVSLRGTIDRWFAELRNVKSARTSTFRISRDAEVLGYIEWANAKFFRSGQQTQIRFLTGDETILQLSEKSDGGEATQQASDIVRDCRGLLTAIPVGLPQPDGEEHYNVLDWLRVFLSPLGRDGRLAASQIRQVANLGSTNPYFLDRLGLFFAGRHGVDRIRAARREWTEFVEKAALLYGVTINLNEEHAAQLVAAILSGRSDASSLAEQFRDRALRALGDVSATGAVASLFLSLGKRTSFDEVAGGRMPVALRFRTEPLMESYYRGFANALQNGKLSNVPERDASAIHLFYANLFAAVGDWRAAANLANVAMLLSPKPCSTAAKEASVYPYEAHFFYAVAARHTARAQSDLEGAAKALERATEIWGQDADNPVDLRLEAEAISQRLSKIHWNIFKANDENGKQSSQELHDCIDKLSYSLAKLRDIPEASYISLPLRKQILTNILLCYLLLRHRYSIHEGHVNQLARNALEDLDKIIREIDTKPFAHSAIYRSSFVTSILAVARWSLEIDPQRKKEYADTAKLWCEQMMAKPFLSYDRERFQFFMNLIDA